MCCFCISSRVRRNGSTSSGSKARLIAPHPLAQLLSFLGRHILKPLGHLLPLASRLVPRDGVPELGVRLPTDLACRTLKDRWTVVTVDGSLSAQWEHTIVVASDGCEILTDRNF